jgi:NitT/TauT family transport system permease protein
MSRHDRVDRDLDILETHETDPLTAFEGDLPAGTKTPSALRLRFDRYLPALALFFFVLVAWEGLTRVLDVESFLLPKPTEIAGKLIENFDVIWAAAVNTLIEAIGGFVVGALLGVAVALATVRWAAAREGLMPFAIAANSIPIIAIAPITNAMFSLTSPVSKMAVVAIVVFFPVMINTARGLTEVDPAEIELMRSYASHPRTVLTRVRVPNALPYFFSSLKVASALSIIAAIVAEYFGGPQDVLGQYIVSKAQLFSFPSAWAAIVVASAIGIAFYGLILLAERVFMPWHISFRSADDR